jgi:ketosteroid isomerase-like protein
MRSRSLALALFVAGWCTGFSTSGNEAQAAKEATPGTVAQAEKAAPPAKAESPAPAVPPAESEAQRQVRATEQAFARTMADRDHAAFATFLSDDAIFMSEKRTLRGKAQVTEGWKGFYAGAAPPFAWEPETVEVLESGQLALSTGPVRNAQGERVGTFNSIWRREADGHWRVVFDKGCPPCNCK